MNQIMIQTEHITLAAFLKFCGAADSGGEASGVIADGTVCVNGEICRQRGKKLRPGDIVSLDDRQYEVRAQCV